MNLKENSNRMLVSSTDTDMKNLVNNPEIVTEPERIKVNIGGTIFETLKETLGKIPYFHGILSKKWKVYEVPFIDRDPRLFREILNFLRDPSYDISENARHEATHYYCMDIVSHEYTQCDFFSELLENTKIDSFHPSAYETAPDRISILSTQLMCVPDKTKKHTPKCYSEDYYDVYIHDLQFYEGSRCMGLSRTYDFVSVSLIYTAKERDDILSLHLLANNNNLHTWTHDEILLKSTCISQSDIYVCDLFSNLPCSFIPFSQMSIKVNHNLLIDVKGKTDRFIFFRVKISFIDRPISKNIETNQKFYITKTTQIEVTCKDDRKFFTKIIDVDKEVFFAELIHGRINCDISIVHSPEYSHPSVYTQWKLYTYENSTRGNLIMRSDWLDRLTGGGIIPYYILQRLNPMIIEIELPSISFEDLSTKIYIRATLPVTYTYRIQGGEIGW
jgi:hypothetical protein